MVSINMQPGGRFVATNVTLRQLITQAYRLQSFQLVGEPDWGGNDRFDINAKAEGDVPPTPPGAIGTMQLMLQAMLADRFGLRAHEEEREMPIYALVLAREDGRLGPNLQPSTFDCQAMAGAARGGTPPAPPSPGARPNCGVRMGRGMGGGTLTAGAVPVSQLPTLLAPMVQRYVVDRTGLTGNYDMDLTYSVDQAPSGGLVGATTPVPAGGDSPSIYTALQEQLGLKLDSQRGPVHVLVIDAVHRPTED
jgi:uncharacterized protein (TIGR03435 family)